MFDKIILCKNGSTVIANGNFITVSGGGTYTFSGGYLHGPNGFFSRCGSIEEAKAMVVGMNGGRSF